MKAFYAIVLLVFLASCGSQAVVEQEVQVVEPVAVVEQVTQEIEEAIEEIPAEIVEVMESSSEESTPEAMQEEVVKLDAAYTNPAGPVDMSVEYSLDSEGKIAAIDVSATTYDLTDFSAKAQSVVGMTVEDASEFVFSGSSLTGTAFQNALKSAQ